MDNYFCFYVLPTMIPMKPSHLVILFLSFCAVFSYPSKPLNERSEDISWQAWLLVDDQNQNNKQQYSNGDDGILRRRITSKSVFIAPTFSPDDLPACADGYTSDSMNRCVPIFKIDEDAHLNFLLNKLSNKFGDLDMGDEEEDYELEEIIETKTTNNKPDRLQIDIPLLPDDASNTKKDHDQLEPEMTIIITPTSKTNPSGLKLDKREDDLEAEEELRKLFRKPSSSTTASTSTTTQRVTESTINNSEIANGDDVASTTEKIDDVTDSETEITTNFEEATEGTENNNAENTSVSTTLSNEDTVTLFTTTEASTINFEDDQSMSTILAPKVTTYHPKMKVQESPSTTTMKFLIRFPDEDEEEPEEETAEPTSIRHQTDFVRFPIPQMNKEIPSKSVHHPTRDVHSQVGFFPGAKPTAPLTKHSNDRILFPQDQPMADQADRVVFTPTQGHLDQVSAGSGLTINMDEYPKVESSLTSSTTQRVENARKSRERNLLLPSRWEVTGQTDGVQKKPLVLRLRKQIFVDSDQFKNKKFYRSVPVEHLSYLFGYNSQSRHR